MKRQEKWLEKGYTKEQIETHLQFERHKSKLSREKRKRLNEQNKEIINIIKKDLLGITFNVVNGQIEVLKISPSTDGVGFWYKYKTTFKDGSSGEFRQFFDFDGYKYDDFVEWLRCG
jgi:hypothetical protein